MQLRLCNFLNLLNPCIVVTQKTLLRSFFQFLCSSLAPFFWEHLAGFSFFDVHFASKPFVIGFQNSIVTAKSAHMTCNKNAAPREQQQQCASHSVQCAGNFSFKLSNAVVAMNAAAVLQSLSMPWLQCHVILHVNHDFLQRKPLHFCGTKGRTKSGFFIDKEFQSSLACKGFIFVHHTDQNINTSRPISRDLIDGDKTHHPAFHV